GPGTSASAEVASWSTDMDLLEFQSDPLTRPLSICLSGCLQEAPFQCSHGAEELVAGLSKRNALRPFENRMFHFFAANRWQVMHEGGGVRLRNLFHQRRGDAKGLEVFFPSWISL